MAQELQLLLAILFFGGLIGWSLFGYITFRVFGTRHQELRLINELKEEIKEIKKEVQNLK